MPYAAELRLARLYRAVFVDLGGVSDHLARRVPRDAKILDIGGGDGDLLNTLLEIRPDVHVTMVDVADTVGRFVQSRYLGQVTRFPGVKLEDHLMTVSDPYDCALVSDVLHHLPPSYREQFLASVMDALSPKGSLFVKDIEPGYPISWLSVFCDKYISGDRGVELVSQRALRETIEKIRPEHDFLEIGLFDLDKPNYLVMVAPHHGD